WAGHNEAGEGGLVTGEGGYRPIERRRAGPAHVLLTLPSHCRCHAGGMTQGTIVVVEDDAHICDLVDMLLRAEGYRVIQAAEGIKGLTAIDHDRPRIAILDVGLPDIDG